MNVENVRLWVEDLERNQHPQTRETLCRSDADGELVGYCCLGRACEVAIAHGLELKTYDECCSGTRYTTYNNASALPPKAVQEWLGIDASDLGRDPGCEHEGSFYSELAEMNDNGATFPELAAYIREHVTGL